MCLSSSVTPIGTKKVVHVAQSENRWTVRQTGATRAYRAFNTEDEAIAFATRYSGKGHDIVVHNEDGYVIRTIKAK